ncbi:MAG TPA: DUF4132 domain-containing protein [Cyclobacteriaceae bacterium]
MSFLSNIKKVFASKEFRQFDAITEDALQQLWEKKDNYWNFKPNNDYRAFQKLISLPDKEKVGFIIYAVAEIHSRRKGITIYSSDNKELVRAMVLETVIQHLLKTKLVLDGADVAGIVSAFRTHKKGNWSGVTGWPVVGLVHQVEKNFKDKVLPSEARQAMIQLKETLEADRPQLQKDMIKLIERIDTLVFAAENTSGRIKPVYFLGDDAFADYANPIIKEFTQETNVLWYKIIAHAQAANASKPSVKWLSQSQELLKELGTDKFKKVAVDWFDFVIRLKEKEEVHTNTYQGHDYTYSSYEFLSGSNIDALKGLVWMCAHFHDSLTLQKLAALAERSFKKIPGRGPAAASVGNACLFALFKSKGLDGIAHLSRLKLRVKQNSTQALIDKYLQEAAKQEGVSVSEIEDLAVDDFGLVNGAREYELEDYKLKLSIKGVGDVEQSWFKPDGTQQKSVPSVVKEKQKEKLNKIKNTAKQIEVSTTAQRDRIDRMLRSERVMTWEYFDRHFNTHGLMSFLTHSIIWNFDDGQSVVNVIYSEGAWRRNTHEIVTPSDACKVSLWHPVTANVSEVKKWRNYLIEQKITQPIKQAFREVYFLTDAEVNTRTYSNRMAAHILKQHQFNSLAKGRGWKYALLGAYDDGRYNTGAELNLPEYGMRAEYWVNEVNSDGAFNDTGIWLYVATDQVRFVNVANGEPLQLIDVPKIPFSEVMRDVDLFVGVASVGNDPTWNDSGGLPAHRDYWQAYSFGELSEVAKNRKETLEQLVPRLKIASVSQIKDKFLVVQGKLRTYKIHIGSTNILMEPNDQYLCIVPDRSSKPMSDLFLPFEGDAGLSVILSKAFLLAADEKITDSTITSQINRK